MFWVKVKLCEMSFFPPLNLFIHMFFTFRLSQDVKKFHVLKSAHGKVTVCHHSQDQGRVIDLKCFPWQRPAFLLHIL